jgi:YVTN family beta-propeller protein
MEEDIVLIEVINVMLTTIIVVLLMVNSSTFLQVNSLSPAIRAFGSVSSLTSDSLAGVMYVQNKDSNSISAINLATNTIVRNITVVDETLYNIKLSEDQLRLYILTADGDSGTVLVLNTTSNELMNEISTGVSAQDIAIFNDTLYVGDVLGGRLLVMNTNGTLIDEINVGSRPQYMEVRPDGRVLYVTRLGGVISVVDLEQNIVIKEIDSESTPLRLSFTNDGSRLFVVNSESDTLSVIDTHKQEVIKTISVGDNPQYVALNPDETLAYVTNMDSNTVTIVDAQVIEVVNEIPVGNGPYGIAFSVDGGDLSYVSSSRGNDVSIINTGSSNTIATLSSGGAGPSELVVRRPDIEIIRTKDNDNNSSVITQVFVEVPDDQEEFMRGLMFRQNLPWNAGMLFAFNNEEPRTFWMKNTLIPLDMIFVDSGSKIVDIIENVPPCEQDECPSYPSKEPAEYVLEVNSGFVQDNGIKIGDKLTIFKGSEPDAVVVVVAAAD